jgi:hypothetical protein
MSALEDEESQKKGIVYIAYISECGLDSYTNLLLGRKTAEVFPALPARMRGIHFCIRNNDSGRLIIAALVKTPRTWTRRIRVHKGAFFHYMNFSEPYSALLSKP